MKRLTLIKQFPEIQMGHLYEHIFCMHVDKFFREHHLYPDLDYSLDGKMYYGGIIYIDLELYTDAALELADHIPTLSITPSREAVFSAACQVLAEKEEPIGSTGYDDIKRSLEALHEQPWQHVDDVEQIDTKKMRRKTGAFYLAEGRPLPARKLTTGVLLDVQFATSHRELIPLFRQLAWLITVSLQNGIAEQYGHYSYDDTYKSNKTTMGVYNIFKVARTSDIEVDLSDTLRTCMQIIRDLQEHDAFARLTDELYGVSYYHRASTAPNLDRNYEDTQIFIGSKGWQKIATKENCKLLLAHMSVEVTHGRNKAHHALV